MTVFADGTRRPWPTAASLGLLGAIAAVAAFLALVPRWSAEPLPFVLIFGGYALYPGVVALIAVRSRTPDAVVAAGTFLLGALFAGYLVLIEATPWGFNVPRRILMLDLVIVFGYVAGIFTAISAGVRIARPGGVLRGLGALAVGAALAYALVFAAVVVRLNVGPALLPH